MTEPTRPCGTCGMPCTPDEYHPYAACLMFKACHNSETVRANLEAVRATPPAVVGEPVAVKAMGYGGSTGINDYLMSDGTVKAMRPAEVRWSAQATPQPTQAQAGAVPLTDDRIIELAGLAPNRRVCASTCMTRKIDKKPCQCYPGMRNSEALALARAIEAAHGIKGGQHAE